MQLFEYTYLYQLRCLAVQYPEKLPTASVVMVFFDEPFRLIIRTVFSVVNRSPPALLKEVVLLDDGSTHRKLHFTALTCVNVFKISPYNTIFAVLFSRTS